MDFSVLSKREIDVAKQLATGLNNTGVAKKLGISQRTVEVHRSKIMAKLGIKNAVELGIYLSREDFSLYSNAKATRAFDEYPGVAMSDVQLEIAYLSELLGRIHFRLARVVEQLNHEQ